MKSLLRRVLGLWIRLFQTRVGKKLVDAAIGPQLSLTNARGCPNFNSLWSLAKEVPLIKRNIKNFGYELARMARSELPVPATGGPTSVNLSCKACTQADLVSSWVTYWCGQLRIPVIFHRKIWELCYVLQALHDHDCLRPGSKGVGFGCGQEPLPSLMARYGVEVTVTDLDPGVAKGMGWMETGQHTTGLDQTYMPELVDRRTFDERVSLRYVDMNNIPPDLSGYDFCWSVCALEHLGSIQHGLDFIEKSLAVLKPGGIAVHTTEFNYLNDSETIDNWPTVLFQKRHFQEIADRLASRGHTVMPLDFDVGSDALDKYIDLPPYLHDQDTYAREKSYVDNVTQVGETMPPHLKLALDGFAVTCFGMIIKRGGGETPPATTQGT